MIKDTKKCNEVINQLRDALKKAIKERDDLSSKLLYLQADFENFANRSRKNTEEQVEKREFEVISEMLEILDELEITYERARGKIDDREFLEGLGIIISKFNKKLGALGVTPIDPAGKKFDPALHAAVSTVRVDDPKQEGVVVEVLRKGYMVKRKLIRAAVVKVGVIKGD
ncbi:MAG: nucleotide exchange factor GrpE [Nitrososphaerota archaeon]|jgi:molecular chaperone GrpE|nr:nucleotide exchange factor GrpE [Nitrososphaerota archaeon]MDG6927016.1 nucleotide exchange factor GrpE [Nitrososphaerota archaeon]MDG6930423.1 nucleotide exchange factor GrpE [Nitrososphaerota archaeon]MDG6931464.1 nucleotide exchange factor GrpE [Nitrososphaerota archaeon]MDG6936431.1 nucleotide exchange factor GrpE [Nitrososphaerota archaeon]